MDEQLERQLIGDRAAEISALRPTVDELIGTLTQAVGELSESDFANGADYYRAYMTVSAYHAALSKCSILIEHNLFYLETLGVLALTRYVFEILVWLRVLDRDPDQAIEFYVQIVEGQVEHIKKYEKKLRDEATFFRDIDREDTIPDDLAMDITQNVKSLNPEEFVRRIHEHEKQIDLRARRHFSLYARDARSNGYGFQAFLIENKAIPVAQKQLSEIQKEWSVFESKVGKDEIDRITKNSKGTRTRWNWKRHAESVGMSDQFEFIYGYTSRLLHAHPVSFYTNQKNLEPREMETFLEYTYVSMLDIIALGRKAAGASDNGGQER